MEPAEGYVLPLPIWILISSEPEEELFDAITFRGSKYPCFIPIFSDDGLAEIGRDQARKIFTTNRVYFRKIEDMSLVVELAEQLLAGGATHAAIDPDLNSRKATWISLPDFIAALG